MSHKAAKESKRHRKSTARQWRRSGHIRNVIKCENTKTFPRQRLSDWMKKLDLIVFSL